MRMQPRDVILQPVAVGGSHRRQLPHADLNHTRQVLDLLLRGLDDYFLSLETDHHLGA